ncbi:probable E3 ubiquitin-protein ligase XERICO [Prosopis cineraria]|uniref:probable E3 ubiquitin-protein ligase XERICO n=1 Tax=Prosopis cineraria TaxID=364024 RepID=UPI002410336F|nr:probable E3 ubiquitin-protein ligase XERICO [Prosopis cineraria]
MGLSNILNLSEGILPALVVNTVLSVVLLKNMLRSVLEAVGVTSSSSSSSSSQNMEEDSDEEGDRESCGRRRVSITQYKEVCGGTSTSDSDSRVGGLGTVECCVCLSGFEANQEVSELPCKHFFHRGCLDKWFDNKHLSCPLCRSID